MSVLNFLFLFNKKTSSSRSSTPGHIINNALVNYTILPLIFFGIASLTINSLSLKYGILVSLMMPTALIIPSFLKDGSNSQRVSYIYLLSSLIIGPIFLINYTKLLFVDYAAIETLPLFKSYGFLILLPIPIAYLLKKTLPKVVASLKENSVRLNIVFLSILFFILSGNIHNKVISIGISTKEIIISFLIVSLYDFSTYFLVKYFYKGELKDVLALSFSVKNVALACGILLFYDPFAAIVPALNLISHMFIFSYSSKSRDC